MVSNTIDFKEFKAVYEILGKKITELEYNNQILNKYNNFEKALTQKGFTDWFIDQTKAEGEDTIFAWLEKFGYDRDLYSIRSRLFGLTFHSKTLENNGPIEVKIRDAIGTDIDNQVNKQVLRD